MSVRMRHTSSHSKNRRSHHALKKMSIIKDATSGALRRPHRLDETTGMYRGKLVMTPKAKKEKVVAEKVKKEPKPKAEKKEKKEVKAKK